MVVLGALRCLARHSTWLLAGGIFLGLLWPDLAHWLAPLFAASVVGLLAATLIRQDFGLLRKAAGRWRLILVVLVWQLFGSAALIFVVVQFLQGFGWPGNGSELPMIMILAAACPPILSSIAFALLFRLDAAFTTLLVLAAVFLAPLTLPLVALIFVDQPLGISTGAFMVQLAILVGMSTAIAGVVHAVLGKAWIARQADEIDGIAVILLIFFGVAIMDGVAARLMEKPGQSLIILIAALGLNAVLHLIALPLFRFAGKPVSRTIGIASGSRNLGLLFAALGSAASADLALFLALAQLPIYFTPLILRSFYGAPGATERRAT